MRTNTSAILDVIGERQSDGEIRACFSPDLPLNVIVPKNDAGVWVWRYESRKTVSSEDAKDHVSWLIDRMLGPAEEIDRLLKKGVYLKLTIVTIPSKHDVIEYCVEGRHVEILNRLGLELNVKQFFV